MARPHRGRGGPGGRRRGRGGPSAPRRAAALLGAASLGRAGCAGLHRGAVRGRRPPRRRQAPWAAHHAGRRALPRVDAARRGPGARPGGDAHPPAGARHLGRGALRPDPGRAVRAAAGAAGAARPQGLPGALHGPPGGRRLRRGGPHRRGPLPAHRNAPRRHPGRPAVAEPGPGPGAARGRGGVVAPRGGDRDRPPAPESASTWPSPATRSLGDPLFGAGGLPFPGGLAVPGDPGYRLHAFRVELAHPRTGAPVEVECAPPPVLRLLPPVG